MMTNSYGNKNFHAANEKAQHARMRGTVFFLGAEREGGREDFFSACSLCALIMFSYGSHQVPQVLKLFLKTRSMLCMFETCYGY